MTGRNAEAQGFAERALKLSRERKARGYEAWSLRLLGDIFSDPNNFDSEKSKRYYQEAMSLADELGMRPLLAHCHSGLGKLYRKTGLEESAKENLKTAVTMFRDMDMPFWLNKMEDDIQERNKS